jgi:2-keto-3-deoxy-L-rhamnonate aldolase RhmA
VLLPLVREPEDLLRGMRFGRYPPAGERGVGGERAVKWGLGFEEYLASANEETLIIPIIETREAAEEIDSILEVPGLEAIFFGPADLSASHGYLGEWEGPGIAERILEIREKATQRGIAAGVLSRSIPEAVLRRDQGFGMIALGADTGLLIRGVTEALAELGEPASPRSGL